MLVILGCVPVPNNFQEFLKLWESGYSKITNESKKETGKYLGNLNSNKFHKPDYQWAQKMGRGNRAWFETREKAIRAGYQSCKICKP
jgi:micrococcal nuclease